MIFKFFTFFVILVHQVVLHLMSLPHVVLDDMPALLLHWRLIFGAFQASIGQVLELISEIVDVVVLCCESQVWLLPHPDR